MSEEEETIEIAKSIIHKHERKAQAVRAAFP